MSPYCSVVILGLAVVILFDQLGFNCHQCKLFYLFNFNV